MTMPKKITANDIKRTLKDCVFNPNLISDPESIVVTMSSPEYLEYRAIECIATARQEADKEKYKIQIRRAIRFLVSSLLIRTKE